jgi:hypothetical protein
MKSRISTVDIGQDSLRKYSMLQKPVNRPREKCRRIIHHTVLHFNSGIRGKQKERPSVALFASVCPP